MHSKRILILGAGRYNVPSIAAARQAGFFALVADRNKDAPGLKLADIPLAIDVNDCDSLTEAIRQNGGIDGVISMAEVGVRSAARISAELGLPSISEEAAANATSKANMRRLWRTISNYSVEFEVVSSLDEAEKAVRRLAHFPLIFKPDCSFGGSRGVTKIHSFEQVFTAFQDAKSGGLPNSNVVIEECVEGSEHSAEVLVWEDLTSVLCIGQKVKSLPPYRVDVSVQYPAELTDTQRQTVAEMCDHAAKTLGLSQGVAHVEFAYTQRGPVLFELGARCGGGHTPQIVHHVSGVNEFVEACRMACGIAPVQFTPIYSRGADYRFLVFPAGKVEGIEIPPSISSSSCVLDVGLTVGVGQTVSPLRATSDRSGFLVATGDTLEEAIECADRGSRGISITYADGTTQHPIELAAFQELTPR